MTRYPITCESVEPIIVQAKYSQSSSAIHQSSSSSAALTPNEAKVVSKPHSPSPHTSDVSDKQTPFVDDNITAVPSPLTRPQFYLGPGEDEHREPAPISTFLSEVLSQYQLQALDPTIAHETAQFSCIERDLLQALDDSLLTSSVTLVDAASANVIIRDLLHQSLTSYFNVLSNKAFEAYGMLHGRQIGRSIRKESVRGTLDPAIPIERLPNSLNVTQTPADPGLNSSLPSSPSNLFVKIPHPCAAQLQAARDAVNSLSPSFLDSITTQPDPSSEAVEDNIGASPEVIISLPGPRAGSTQATTHSDSQIDVLDGEEEE